jgi:hypothetical protein
MIGSLAKQELKALDYVSILTSQSPLPETLAELHPDPDRKIFIWDGTGRVDDHPWDATPLVVVYALDVDSSSFSASVRLLGSGYVGGWFSDTAQGYLCVKYSLDSGEEEVSRAQVTCPDEVRMQSDYAILVDLEEVYRAEESKD